MVLVLHQVASRGYYLTFSLLGLRTDHIWNSAFQVRYRNSSITWKTNYRIWGNILFIYSDLFFFLLMILRLRTLLVIRSSMLRVRILKSTIPFTIRRNIKLSFCTYSFKRRFLLDIFLFFLLDQSWKIIGLVSIVSYGLSKSGDLRKFRVMTSYTLNHCSQWSSCHSKYKSPSILRI